MRSSPLSGEVPTNQASSTRRVSAGERSPKET
jgi:hypothetical protein